MNFVDIFCKDGTVCSLTFHELRITKHTTRVKHDELGHFVIGLDKVKDIYVTFNEEDDE